MEFALRTRDSSGLVPAILLAGVIAAPSALDAQAEASEFMRTGCVTQGDWRPGEMSLATYLDSALVATALRPRWKPEWGRVIATMSAPRDSADAQDRVWVGTRTENTEGLDQVGAWLLQARNETTLPERTEITLLIGDDGEFDFRGVELAECAPVFLARGRVTPELEKIGRDQFSEFTARRLSVAELSVWMFVDENGAVGEIEVHEPSLLPGLNRQVVDMLRRLALFEPARREGIPVGVWVQMPVTVHPIRR